MQDKILGESTDGTIIYKRLNAKYLQEAVLVARKTLFTTGTVSRALGIPGDVEAQTDLSQLSSETAKDGISVIAVEKETDKVVGVAFNKILTKSKPFFEQFRTIFKNSNSRCILEYIISTDNFCDMFEHCNVECLMEILFLGTLPEHRKKGIAKKLCELSVDVAQNLYNGVNVKESIDGGVLDLEPIPQAVYAMFTSFISQKIGRELGFTIAAERSNKKIEVMGRVFENENTETPVTTKEYLMLKKK